MTTQEATARHAGKQDRRDWLYPWRLAVLLVMWVPLVIIGALLSAAMHGDEQ